MKFSENSVRSSIGEGQYVLRRKERLRLIRGAGSAY